MRLITALAAVLALVGTPVLAIDIDPANPPPWPLGPSVAADIPSRFDRAAPAALLAAARGGRGEPTSVLTRRIAAGDPVLYAWAVEGAARDDPGALMVLGRFRSTEGAPGGADPAEAARLFRKAADLGEPEAMRRLAGLYAGGIGVPQDRPEALRWWKRAAEAGDGSAMFALSNAWRGDDDPGNDAQAAIYSYRSAAILGWAPDPYQPTYDVAALTAAAEGGDVGAMRKLGDYYASGLGIVTPDPRAALRWYGLAAEAGDPTAMAQLGAIYLQGKGVRSDKPKGLALLHRAAEEASIPIAMYYLEQAYRTGDGVPADAEAARQWRYRMFWAPRVTPAAPRIAPISSPPPPPQFCADPPTLAAILRLAPSDLEAARALVTVAPGLDPAALRVTGARAVLGPCAATLESSRDGLLVFHDASTVIAATLTPAGETRIDRLSRTERGAGRPESDLHPTVAGAEFIGAAHVDHARIEGRLAETIVGLWRRGEEGLVYAWQVADGTVGEPKLILTTHEPMTGIGYFPAPDAPLGGLSLVQTRHDQALVIGLRWSHPDLFPRR